MTYAATCRPSNKAALTVELLGIRTTPTQSCRAPHKADAQWVLRVLEVFKSSSDKAKALSQCRANGAGGSGVIRPTYMYNMGGLKLPQPPPLAITMPSGQLLPLYKGLEIDCIRL